MDAVSIFLGELLAALSARLPGRVVTNEFLDHSQRKVEQLRRGVVTILLGEIDPDADAWCAGLSLKIVGQIAVPERGAGSGPAAVQAAELRLWNELLAALRNPGPGFPAFELGKAKFSCQLDAPFGWVAQPVSVGAIDMATGDLSVDYPVTDPDAAGPASSSSDTFGELARVQLDFDTEPFSDAAIHQQWAAEQSSTEQPDLTATVELQP